MLPSSPSVQHKLAQSFAHLSQHGSHVQSDCHDMTVIDTLRDLLACLLQACHFGLYGEGPNISGEEAFYMYNTDVWTFTIQPKVARLAKIGKSRPNQAACVVPCDLS